MGLGEILCGGVGWMGRAEGLCGGGVGVGGGGGGASTKIPDIMMF